MDVRRISIMAALAVVSYLMILQWSKDYSGVEPTTSDVAQAVVVDSSGVVSENVASDIPQGNSTTTQTPTAATAPSDNRLVTVKTNELIVTIDLNGGDVLYTGLPKYPANINTPNVPFAILENVDRTYIAQSGLVGENGVDAQNRAQYTSEQSEYTLNGDSLDVVLTHVSKDGIVVKKTYRFTNGSYLMDIRYDVENKSAQTVRMNLFAQLRRDKSEDPSATGGIGMNSYLGTTFSTSNEAYNKVKFKDLEKERFTDSSTGGWVAILQHYFLSAFVPAQTDVNNYYGQQGKNGHFYAGYQAPTMVMGPGESASTATQLYVGPKDQDSLELIAPNLEKTVDYGWLWWIATPIFKLLQIIHGWVGNWGWAIVLMTLTIKMVLYPLTASSYRSMAKMKKFAPKIQEMRDMYGDDRQKMSQEMMKLYQKEKLNPLGGCLPMLVQMPVFIALYWVLMESVELRQSPFIFWIVDMSVKDPYFVLPLLMGASMFFQMQMQQQPTMDPMQAKIMKLMPIMFTFMFLWFPAGLTLYWFVNNLITIAQQAYVNRSVQKADAKAK
ncbi:membrane protein insertase YidC [Reinekea forsetii]|nr:membrane protein insertase YidC [Reinekea forsetii]